MQIDAKLVLKLRQSTSAGFLDCKKALVEAAGDLEKAVKILREKGIAKAIKKADREVGEGITMIAQKDDRAIAIKLNCETDFVAVNKKFLDLAEEIMNFALSHSEIQSLETLLKAHISDISVEKYILQVASTLGENFVLSQAIFLTKDRNDVFGIYNHANNKVSAITVIHNGDAEIAKNVAMHISAMNPIYISFDEVDPKVIANEKAILLENALNENKAAAKPLPEQFLQKKIDGRLKKLLSEKCLLEQTYVKEPSLKIHDYLKKTQSSIKKFVYLNIK